METMMVTAEEVEIELRKNFCPRFGFSPNDLIIKKENQEIVKFHGLISTPRNRFVREYLEKPFWLTKDKKTFEKLKKDAEQFFKKFSGGSGYLNWDEIHEIKYKIFESLTEEQAEALLLYPTSKISKLKELMPNLATYLDDPGYLNHLKFLAFIKFVYSKWGELFTILRSVALKHQQESKETHSNKKILPWYWSGEINKINHALCIHEAIHNIIRNSGVEKTFNHNAWNEGIDVFFHRRSGLFFGFYGKHHSWNWWFLRKNINVLFYWKASQIFWDELKNMPDLELKKVLSNPQHPNTLRIIQNIKKEWPKSEQFPTD